MFGVANKIILFHAVIIIIMNAPNSHTRKGGKWRGSMEVVLSRRMLTTEEWCNPVSNMLHYV